MKIIEKQTSVLTDWEVLSIVREHKAEYEGSDSTGRARPMPVNLKRILRDVETQLGDEPSPLAGGNNYRSDNVRALFAKTRAAGFALEKTEMLMICNVRPTSLAELDIVIEELDARYNESRQAALLAIVRECLGPLDAGEAQPAPDEKSTDWKHDRRRRGGAEIGLDGMRLGNGRMTDVRR